MIRIALAVVLSSACSSTAGPPSKPAAPPAKEKAPPPAEIGVAFDRTGELGTCDPTGTWRAVGAFRGVGDCPASEQPVVIEVEVSRGARGYRLVVPDGMVARADSLGLNGGACALSFELRYQVVDRDRPHVVVFADLVAGGKSVATWDEYEPIAGGASFDPAESAIRCSDALELEVTR